MAVCDAYVREYIENHHIHCRHTKCLRDVEVIRAELYEYVCKHTHTTNTRIVAYVDVSQLQHISPALLDLYTRLTMARIRKRRIRKRLCYYKYHRAINATHFSRNKAFLHVIHDALYHELYLAPDLAKKFREIRWLYSSRYPNPLPHHAYHVYAGSVESVEAAAYALSKLPRVYLFIVYRI